MTWDPSSRIAFIYPHRKGDSLLFFSVLTSIGEEAAGNGSATKAK